MKKIRVGIIYGGISSERTVSLLTGQAIFDNIPRNKYAPTLIEMTKKSTFVFRKGNKKIDLNLEKEGKKLFDVIFVALHGEGGEDGKLQGFLDTIGLRYTGSGVTASALAMDKMVAGILYQSAGLATPPFVSFTKNDWQKNKNAILNKAKKFGPKVVVKPVDQGSAVGVTIVQSQRELTRVVEKTLKQFTNIMVQKFIAGAEATCGVLEKNGQAFALPPTHILPLKNAFYDFASKYKQGGSQHVCPADFGSKINKKIQAMALQAHQVLRCRGMSRSDIMVGNDGICYLLETNTIPGMTATSLLPEAAQKAGITFSEMLDLIIKASL